MLVNIEGIMPSPLIHLMAPFGLGAREEKKADGSIIVQSEIEMKQKAVRALVSAAAAAVLIFGAQYFSINPLLRGVVGCCFSVPATFLAQGSLLAFSGVKAIAAANTAGVLTTLGKIYAGLFGIMVLINQYDMIDAGVLEGYSKKFAEYLFPKA